MPALVGSDAVTLVFRDPVTNPDQGGAPVISEDGRPVFVDRPVEKSKAKFTIIEVTETDVVTGAADTSAVPPVVVYKAKCALQVDSDAQALKTKDAIEHDGKRFELSGDARVKRTLIDSRPHHVRVFCSRTEQAGSVVEVVVVTPRGGQDDDGRRLADGEPITLVARAVDPGNTAERYGAQGTIEAVDFTVVLAAGSPVSDGDWIQVRGHDCVARVQREFSQQADRSQDVVLARSRTGGG